jgi:hypothetical protein
MSDCGYPSLAIRRIHDIPDDILILVFSYFDIDTLLATRLVCTAFQFVIHNYIKTIAPRVAQNTLPDCKLLLVAPKEGYSLRWLRSRIPVQLATVALDKDKLRRYPYLNSGFPYGIPSESDCEEAELCRADVANGWRVLRSLHLISAGVYAKSDDEIKELIAYRKASKSSRIRQSWRDVSSMFSARIKHSTKHMSGAKYEKSPGDTTADNLDCTTIDNVHRREFIVLDKRLAFIERLPDKDLRCYTYLWRILMWTFRPYRKPNGFAFGTRRQPYEDEPVLAPSTSSMISDIPQGCSWLNWYILFVGPDPFRRQWHLIPSYHIPHHPNVIRNMIWRARAARTPLQIEVEREYVSKFELALRKRCLPSESLKLLESSKNPSLRTISSDSIPWAYDQHHMTPRPASDFPWYEAGKLVWLDGDWCVRITPGTAWSQPGALAMSMTPYKYRACELSLLWIISEMTIGSSMTMITKMTKMGVRDRLHGYPIWSIWALKKLGMCGLTVVTMMGRLSSEPFQEAQEVMVKLAAEDGTIRTML